ncbi:MAG: PAS domain S-box protein, partial [Chloroflexi bacterium]|nr:PAS domain S-box protein [Chloroflexota bacterium]
IPQQFVTEEEIQLFHEVANDCAFALYDIELQQKHLAAEDALRRSEQNFRDSIESSPLGVRIITADGETLYINRALLDIWGYGSLEELEAVPRKERYTPESYAEHQMRKDKRRRGEFVPSDYEISIVRKDGGIRHLAVSRGEVQWNGKRQFQVLYQDITERKRAEEALRESEERYRTLAENARDVIITTDMNLKITYVSPSVAYLGTRTAEEVMATTVDQLLTPSSLDMAMKTFAEELATVRTQPSGTGRSITMELEIIRQDGSTIWTEARMNFLRTPDGQPIGLMAVLRDASQRKQAEEALQESEERYRTIIEETGDGYFETDLAGNFTLVNNAMCRHHGYSREEMIGMNYKAFTPEANVKDVFEGYNRIYRTGQPLRDFPYEVIRKDGSRAFAETSVFPLRNDKGEIIGFRGVRRDITERKKAEEERQKLELKAQVSSRLASVGEMTAGVAHEINNPLTAVTGYVQLLLDREDISPDARKDLAAINEGARRVAGIVQRLLAFSRQTKPERKYVDINQLIESTLVLRAYHLRTNNIEVTTSLAPDLPQTMADPGQIQQVILNLIVNAEMEMKSAHGKGRLTITTEKSDGTIKICVKDDGPGIKPELMDRIFDPFFTTREVGEGTGLGLSLCYGIVAEHNGKIYAESEPGKGATFIVELPVVTEIETSDAPEPAADEPERV